MFNLYCTMGSEPHRKAQQFTNSKTIATKKQVYLNTLAVSAVEFYLRCMGWRQNWSASFSWNSVWQTLMDVADLEIKFRQVRVPSSVIDTLLSTSTKFRQIGYVAVQLDRSLQQGTLLGTKTAPESGELPAELLSLEDCSYTYVKSGSPHQ